MDPEHESELEALEQTVVERFKHQKHWELTDQISAERDRRLLFTLRAELRALNYDTPEPRLGAQETREQMEVIQSRARALVSLLEEKESQLMLDDLEASMLCEVSRLNLLTFLKVFQADKSADEVTEDSSPSPVREEIARLNDQIANSNDKIEAYKYRLIVKVRVISSLSSSSSCDFSSFRIKNFQRSNP